MANTYRIEAIADMTTDQLTQSPDALKVLTIIGAMAENNPDLARIEARPPGNRSHNFSLGSDLDDTQKLGLAVLKSSSLMGKIPLTMEQAESIVDDVHNQSAKEVEMGTRILRRIAESADRPAEITSSQLAMTVLEQIGKMAEDNGDYRKYAAKDPSLNPSSRSHNVHLGAEPLLSHTQRLGLLVLQNELTGPGIKLTPDHQKIIQDIGHQYMVEHGVATNAPKPDAPQAKVGRGSAFQVPTMGIPTGEAGSPFGGDLSRATADGTDHGGLKPGESGTFGTASDLQKRGRSSAPLKVMIDGAGIPTGEPGSPYGGTLTGGGNDVNHGGANRPESPAKKPLADVYKENIKLPESGKRPVLQRPAGPPM